MRTITVTELRANIYNLLEEVLTTGIPLEVNKGGRKLRIEAIEEVHKLQRLVRRPQVIQGDPEELVSLQWEINLDLP
jgi:prevent-host-death family protein